MSLIIEDGSIVPFADSFTEYADALDRASLLSLPFAIDQDEGEQQLRQAYIWLINMYEMQLQGQRVSAEQTGCFPRLDVYARGFAIASNAIPSDIIDAQIFAASAIFGGVDINTVKTSADLKSFNVQGVYSETYKDSDYQPAIANMPQVYNFMKPYTKSKGGLTLYREDYTLSDGTIYPFGYGLRGYCGGC